MMKEEEKQNTHIKVIRKTRLFFVDTARYQSFDFNDPQMFIGEKFTVDLECSGFAAFKKAQVTERFIEFFQKLLEKVRGRIKVLKLTISGLDVKSDCRRDFFEVLLRQITKISTDLDTLELKTHHISSCNLALFVKLLQVGINQNTHSTLENLTLEFGSWRFEGSSTDVKNEGTAKKIENNKGNGTEQNEKVLKQAVKQEAFLYQPKQELFLQNLAKIFEEIQMQQMAQLKTFRLEISTWYYKEFEYQKFFSIEPPPKENENQSAGNSAQNIQSVEKKFHKQIRRLTQTLIEEKMPNLERLEIDFRNWYNKFQMQQLKGMLLNIKKQNASTNSIIMSTVKKTKPFALGISQIKKSSLGMSMFRGTQNQGKKEEEQKQDQMPNFDFKIIV